MLLLLLLLLPLPRDPSLLSAAAPAAGLPESAGDVGREVFYYLAGNFCSSVLPRG